MQRLSPHDEDGAVAVLVGIMTMLLFGMGALVIDVGAMYAERRQLQNGADAAALAIAHGCAKDALTCGSASGGLAQQYANGNANDGETAVAHEVNFGARTVTIQTSTLNDGSTALPPVFGRVLVPDYDGTTVAAGAIASWGAPISQFASPLGICDDVYEQAGGYSLTPVDESEPTLIDDLLDANCPSGLGFGWLNWPNCRDHVDLNVDQSARVSLVREHGPCRGMLDELLAKGEDGEPVPLPVYGGTSGDAAVLGFAAFLLTGYWFPEDLTRPEDSSRPDGCDPTATCIQGHFRFVATDVGEFGESSHFGVAIVRLTD